MALQAYGSSKEDNPACTVEGFEHTEMELLRHVSFVDCPGHDILMATMLNGASLTLWFIIMTSVHQRLHAKQHGHQEISILAQAAAAMAITVHLSA